MAYKQLKRFNASKGGNKKGLCLQNVRLGFGIGPKYDTALDAWKATKQHRVRSIPAGLDVPLYYSYTATIDGIRKDYGHINVRLADGRVWSDGEYFKSLEDYEARRAPVYLGWGESINGVAVLQYVPDAPKIPAPTGGSFRVKPGFKFRVYNPGTTKVAGVIDHSWGWYKKRGIDPKYPNRWLMNSGQLGLVAFPYADVLMRRYKGEYEEI